MGSSAGAGGDTGELWCVFWSQSRLAHACEGIGGHGGSKRRPRDKSNIYRPYILEWRCSIGQCPNAHPCPPIPSHACARRD